MKSSFVFAALAGVLCGHVVAAPPEPADAVYLGGKVYTVDERFRIVEALAIRGERFLAAGSNEDVRQHVGPRTAVIQLDGRSVLPGLIDTHLHWRDEYEPRLLAVGLTGVHNLNKATTAEVERLTKRYEAGALKIRMNVMLHTSTAFEMGRPRIGLFGHRLTFRGTKVHADNELGPRRAALFDEYSDQPGYFGPWGKHRLRPEIGDEDQESRYADTVARLIRLGFQPRTHAIGDYTNHVVLNAYERALKATGKTGAEVRPVIEHCQILRREPVDDLVRFGKLGVIANIQAVHATEDMVWAEQRVGPQRLNGGYAWRDLLDSGATVIGSSDYTVSPYNPWYGLHAAVTRQDRDNQPPGGWYAHQAMTRDEALRSYTIWAAYAEFAETLKGTIEPGKLADFIVIDRDYLTVPAEDIWKIRVLKTVIGGETVFEAEGVPSAPHGGTESGGRNGGPRPPAGKTYHLSPGADASEIEAAIRGLQAGDVLVFRKGVHKIGRIRMRDVLLEGTEQNPITIRGEDGAVIRGLFDKAANKNPFGPDHYSGIELGGNSQWVIVENLEMRNNGLISVGNRNIAYRDCHIHDFSNYGLITNGMRGLTVENCRIHGSAIEHGIYLTGSNHDVVIRGCKFHDTAINGIHINGRDNVRILVERNVFHHNSRQWGACVTLMGARDATICNNVFFCNLGHIFTVTSDASGVRILHNTIYQPPGEREGQVFVVRSPLERFTVMNNVFATAARALDFQPNQIGRTARFDHNLYSPAAGRQLAELGQERHGVFDAEVRFVGAPDWPDQTADLRLVSGSPGATGATLLRDEAPADFEGRPRRADGPLGAYRATADQE
jgi:predicted amidohydrolase YtcJ